MPWLEQDPSARFHIAFRFGGQKFRRSLKTKDPERANTRLGRLKENIELVESGRLEIPKDADIAAFLLSDGKLSGTKNPQCNVGLAELFAAYRESIPAGSMETNSLATATIHMNHIERILGTNFVADKITRDDLQRYINARSKEAGRRDRRVSATTIKKELTSFGSAWNWALESGHVHKPFPRKKLRFTKTKESGPFQTWREIERQLSCGDLNECEERELWSRLFLNVDEIDEVLEVIRTRAKQPFLYPMAVTAAHTGARRSELLRSQVVDIDIGGRTITIREKKRNKDKVTSRRVVMSPFLAEVLQSWMAQHPGGRYTFCQMPCVSRSKTRRYQPTQITVNEARDHLNRCLLGSKWDKIRGWHIFRHSFVSNCAAAGVDQRIIDAWVGHQTEEMRKRYRHFFPDQQQRAIELVFGGTANGQ